MGGSFVATTGFSQRRNHIQDLHHVPFSVPHFVVAAVFFFLLLHHLGKKRRDGVTEGAGGLHMDFLSSSHIHTPLCELFLEHVLFFKAESSLLPVCSPTETLISRISIMRRCVKQRPPPASFLTCTFRSRLSRAAWMTATSITLCRDAHRRRAPARRGQCVGGWWFNSTHHARKLHRNQAEIWRGGAD